jgi:nucleoid-associated protein YgaU
MTPLSRSLFLCMSLLVWGATYLSAQYGDPAAREDEAIERQKILKAADQIELLVQQNQKLEQEVAKLQQQVSGLQADRDSTLKKMEEFEKSAAKEKQALLKEVAGLMSAKSDSGQSSVKSEKPAADQSSPQEGYEYEVKSGDSLWAIAKAYQDAGVKVTVDEIRKANKMSASHALKAGQKLFIPKN